MPGALIQQGRLRLLVLSVLACVTLVVIASGCKPLIEDPGEHLAVVTLRNDLPRQARVKICGDTRCTNFPSTVTNTLRPGERLGVNIGTDCDCPETYEVEVPGGQPACLQITAGDARRSAVPLSKATSCA